jgi:hypothetical protein
MQYARARGAFNNGGKGFAVRLKKGRYRNKQCPFIPAVKAACWPAAAWR